MKIRLWKDHHNPALQREIQAAWRGEQLLIVAPPTLKDHSFLPVLEQQRSWPEPPILGVFTSGTLSTRPRLALYSRRNIEAALDAIHALFDVSRIEHVFCYPQAFHVFGLILGYVAAHRREWKLHTPLGKYSPASHVQRAQLREAKTLTLGAPTHFYDLIQHCKKNRVELEASYSCILGGAPVTQKLWGEVHRELRVDAPSVGYGCTEASPGITHLPPGIWPERDGEIGYPLDSIKSKVGKRGVKIEGDALCLAIVQKGKIEFPERLWIRDQIEIDVRGSWHFLGRLDLTLNRGGLKYSLEAIERDLSHSLRRQVVTAAVTDQRLGEDLAVAVVGSSSGLDSKQDRVRTQVEDVLSSRWGLRLNPDRLRFVENLPLNECAKLDRRRLRKELQ